MKPILLSFLVGTWFLTASIVAAQSGPDKPVADAASESRSVTADKPVRLGGRYLNQVLATSPRHEKTLDSLLRGKRGLPSWVRSMTRSNQYVAGASRIVTLPAGKFELFGACAPRTCSSSRLRILFTPDGSKGWIKITDAKAGSLVFGEPDADALRQLDMPGL